MLRGLGQQLRSPSAGYSRAFVRYNSTLSNQLRNSSSPYLRSHADNPVAWQEWTDETLKLASKGDKPVFLSIGYHTCHWCHVMNKESFSNQLIADELNKNFIPIKVDREERPDVDAVYMMYLQATTGHGGWPLNVFLVPDTLEPFFGGTYWAGPGVSGRTAKFEDVLKGVQEVWTQDRDKCVSSAGTISKKLRELVAAQSEAEAADFSRAVLVDVKDHFNSTFDSVNGGFSHAPKFPCPHNMSFMLRYHNHLKLDETKNGEEASSATETMPLPEKAAFTLKKIGQGGIKDQVGNGFARYSVTEDWNLPHFEKMLYDQALLLNAYLDCYIYDRDQNEFAMNYALDISTFLTSGSLANPDGGFFSAQDADSFDPSGHHAEGAYYVWTYHEFFEALGGHNIEADMAAMYFNVEEYGNVDSQFDIQEEFKFKNVLSAHTPVEKVAETFGKSVEATEEIIEESRQRLRKYREENRIAPEVDEKIVTCWNGLAIGALARTYRIVDDDLALESAERAAKYLKDNVYDEQSKSLYRIAGATTNGMNEDYAFLVSGLLDLYEATFNTEYLTWARDLQDTQIRLFWDTQNGGFYSVEEDNATDLIFRPKSGFDSAEPSSNGVSAMNLYRLSSMLVDTTYEDRAISILNCYGRDLTAQPFGYSSMMGAVVARMHGMESIIITGQDDKENSRFHEMLENLQSKHRPNTTVVRLDGESVEYFKQLPDSVYGGLYEKHGNEPLKAFVCKNRACMPLENEDAFL